MYLLKKNIFKPIKIRINLLLILSITFFHATSYANEKFIGFVDSLEGNAVIIKGEDSIKLNEFDQIFINDKIKIDLGQFFWSKKGFPSVKIEDPLFTQSCIKSHEI